MTLDGGKIAQFACEATSAKGSLTAGCGAGREGASGWILMWDSKEDDNWS